MQMIESIPLKDITVNRLAQESGVSRGTVYNHFEDIPSLIKEILKEQLNSIINSSTENDSFEDIKRNINAFIVSKKKAIYNICTSSNRIYFEQFLWDILHHSTSLILKACSEGHKISQKELNHLIEFYAGAFFGTLIHWIDKGMPVESEKIEERRAYIYSLGLGPTEELFERAEKLNDLLSNPESQE